MGRPKKRARTSDQPELDEPAVRRKSGVDGDVHTHTWDATVAQEQDGIPAYDMGSYASAFTPDGALQPWLHQTSPGENATSWNSPSSSGVPVLTPDNESLSPAGASSFPSTATGTDLLGTGPFQLDPSLSTNPSIANLTTTCACLSTLYLTLSTLNNMKSAADFTFPAALHPLREAMSTAKTVLVCEECPKSFNTGLQNTTMLGALFLSIAQRFSKVLEHIDAEAARAERAGERKRFRLTDLNGENGGHLHLGGAGCMAAFSLDLSPGEWRSMCKKVVRAEVVGPADGGDGECPGTDEHSQCPYFLGLAKQMEDRQERWHKMPLPDDFPKGAGAMFRPAGHGKKEEHHCLKLVMSSKALVGNFDWS